jgi:phytoene/squalene synthetase
VYLPATRLRAVGIEPDEVARGVADPSGLSAVVADLVAMADRSYARAERGIADLPLRSRLAVVHAASRYRAIGHAVVARGPSALGGRTTLGRVARLGHLLATPLRALRLRPA